jgi:tripartite-type tricarboxylate transporter receptor subunit TctC
VNYLRVSMFMAGAMILSTGVFAQNFPSRPIRMVTTEVGGSNDLVARLIAQGVSGPLGQQVIVENRGGSVIILGQAVASAQPDGHTLVLGTGSLWVVSLLQKAPFDPVRDFAPITVVAKAPNVLVVHPSLPVKSARELIALAKAMPGQLNWASGNAGSSLHLAGELFKSMAGINIVKISYKGMGSALIDTIGGQVQMMFPTAISVPTHIQSGRLRAIGVTSAQPSALFPDLPPIAATVPGYESGTVLSIFAPAKTPQPIINRLNREIVVFLHRPEVREKLLTMGADPVGSSPEEFAALMQSELVRLGKLVKDADIRAD